MIFYVERLYNNAGDRINQARRPVGVALSAGGRPKMSGRKKAAVRRQVRADNGFK